MAQTIAALPARLDSHLARVTRSRRHLRTPLVRLVSDRYGLDYTFGDGATPFHGASIGKLVTAAIVMRLIERGTLTLGAPVADVLGAAVLTGLTTAGDEGQVTVEHLLTHTGGLADYFGDTPTTGPTMLNLVATERERAWTPTQLLDFTRERLRPAERPGAKFHYSDTGYVMLGLVIEAATGETFEHVVHSEVFAPLGMRRSWFATRTQPAEGASAMAPLWLEGHELSTAASLSVDWSGGGIVASPDDWITLSRALHDGRLVGEAGQRLLFTPHHRFHRGIHYGAGGMELRFGEFSPLLRNYSRPTGHIGVLATHAFYDENLDTHIVMNFHSTAQMTRSFRSLIAIEQLLRRLR